MESRKDVGNDKGFTHGYSCGCPTDRGNGDEQAVLIFWRNWRVFEFDSALSLPDGVVHLPDMDAGK